ncbi:glycosyltransferase family 2 protein [Nautilia lithotrophica]
MIKKLLQKWIKPNGISVLIAAQNEEKTIKPCVESFLEFGDEIIIVTNGSTDNTRDICRELVEKYPEKVQFYDKPELPDLYHNRAFALSKAKYRWVAKFDADFIAYTDQDGELSISKLRNKILNTLPFWLIAFKVKLINIYRTINECGIDRNKRKKIDKYKVEGHYVPQVYSEMAKVFLNTPLLKFIKIGRWEHIPYSRFYINIKTKKPYIFHLTLNDDKTLFYRSERTNWRELGDFKKYPTLEDYILKYVLPIKYKMPLNKAIEKYINEDVLPFLQEYDEKKYYPYPKIIKRLIENGYFN